MWYGFAANKLRNKNASMHNMSLALTLSFSLSLNWIAVLIGNL